MISHAFAREALREYLVESGYRSASIATQLAYIDYLFEYLSHLGVDDLRNVDRSRMVDFARSINGTLKKRDTKPLSPRTKTMIWAIARRMFRVLYERMLMLANPTRGIRFAPTGSDRLLIPLSQDEVARFLDGIDESRRLGLRDRALFELIYSSGLRAGEASALIVGDLDFDSRLVKVRQGKFSRDRVVPMTELAATSVAELVRRRKPDEPVFRSTGGGTLTAYAINRRYKRLMARQGLDREGLSVHALRHACATHLIDRGADIRYVQALLGHESVETTVIYTRDRVDNLRRHYLRAHPRENEYRATVDDGYRADFDRFLVRMAHVARCRMIKAARLLRLQGHTREPRTPRSRPTT